MHEVALPEDILKEDLCRCPVIPKLTENVQLEIEIRKKLEDVVAM